jgi:uncharacterized membrane protein
MTLYELLLLLHIVAAILWVGAAATFFMLDVGDDLSGDLEAQASHNDDADWLSPRLFIPASLATLLFGLAAAIEGDWDFGSLWIVIGLAGFTASFLTGILYFAPELKRVAEATQRHGPSHPEVRRRIATAKLVGQIELAVLFAVVAAMVIKPTGDDTGVLVAGALFLLAVTAIAFAWRGRDAAHPAQR